jgi:Lrp/AsnC family transcriptional regulator for asnA, asnC and gidA
MEDARKPILQIANKIGISGCGHPPRLRKLEQSGVISGSKFVVSNKVLGYSTMAFVGIYLDKAARNLEAVRELRKSPKCSNATTPPETGLSSSKSSAATMPI